MNICPFCSEEVEANVLKCPHCGEIITKKTGNSWVISLFLALPLGFLGLHSFYNNKKAIGITQLLLTVSVVSVCVSAYGAYGFLISFLWGSFADPILILFDEYKDSQGRKLSRKITIKSTALLSLIFLHRFYVKRYISAIFFYLTLGGFGIWWLVDLITILTGHFKDENGNLITE